MTNIRKSTPRKGSLQIRKPDWLRVGIQKSEDFYEIARNLRSYRLHTVCEEANCPNSTDCWSRRTATFMILGDVCTRSCRFCAVESSRIGKPLDSQEPERLAEVVKKLGIKYVVITSVDRDDLSDGGAKHFAKCVLSVKRLSPESKVEVLIPDFGGKIGSLKYVVSSRPNIIAHNIETVRRLHNKVRDKRASYDLSLNVLETVKKLDKRIWTKSSLMVGVGETKLEVLDSIKDLKDKGVDIITIGQYLQPNRKKLSVEEYIAPEIFDYFKIEAKKLGFKKIFSGPLVRSSYHADELSYY
ncbi:lipoyl synthase [[Eubacterium] cellulosolvens]